LHQTVTRFGRHRLEAASEPEHLAQVGDRQRQRIGCTHVECRLDEARHVDHRLAVFVVRFGVEPRVTQNFTSRAAVIVHTP